MNLKWHARDLSGIPVKVFANNKLLENTHIFNLSRVTVNRLTITGEGSVRGYKVNGMGNTYIDPNSTHDEPYAAEYEVITSDIELHFERLEDVELVIEWCCYD